MLRLLIFLVTLGVHALRAIFRTREGLLLENLALRQQVAALKKERPRPVLDDVDRAFWISYYHADRCHLGLDKDAPDRRPVTTRPSATAKVVALPRVGGLHRRYEWREAA